MLKGYPAIQKRLNKERAGGIHTNSPAFFKILNDIRSGLGLSLINELNDSVLSELETALTSGAIHESNEQQLQGHDEVEHEEGESTLLL